MNIIDLKAEEFKIILATNNKEKIIEKYKSDMFNSFIDGGLKSFNKVREQLHELDLEIGESMQEIIEKKNEFE